MKPALIVLLFIFSSLSSPAVFAQDFSSIDTDLQALENLLQDTIANTAPNHAQQSSVDEELDKAWRTRNINEMKNARQRVLLAVR